MADETDLSEKTEDPTQKRLDDALERGDVAKSQEVNTWFIIAGATLALSSFSSSLVSVKVSLRDLLANSHAIRVDGTSLLLLVKHLEGAMISSLGLPFLILVI